MGQSDNYISPENFLCSNKGGQMFPPRYIWHKAVEFTIYFEKTAVGINTSFSLKRWKGKMVRKWCRNGGTRARDKNTKEIFYERLNLRILSSYRDLSQSTQENDETVLLYSTFLPNHRYSTTAYCLLLNYVCGCYCVSKHPIFIEAGRLVLNIL
jgi:hypothetical protein